MARKTNNLKHDPRALCQAYFSLAKKWFIVAYTGKCLVFLLGVLSILLPLLPGYAPFLVVAMAASADFFSWYSDAYKGTAEALLRKLDGRDSFGWAISHAELSDLLMRSPSNLDKLVFAEALAEEYFASKEGVGAKRALENIQESAWWSKHLSERMGRYYLIGTCILIILSVSVLLVSIQTINNTMLLASIGRIVTSVLLLVFSLGLFRSVLGYYNFSSKAAQIEKYIENQIASQNFDVADAIKVMNEYHLARASSPLIPSWIWKSMRNELNETWKKYRQP
jgi:hypothetical protein